MSEDARHPLFARCWERIARTTDRGPGARHRKELLAGLSGRVLEVGAGTGTNFSHYPETVREVLALEPEPYLRERARQAAAHAPVTVEVRPGHAESIPAEDGSFDAVVLSLVLCSVSDQAAALAQARRVLRPGGELRFYEHVVSDSSGWALVQRLADATFWPGISGGCHMARDTAAAMERAGFTIERSERFVFGPVPDRVGFPHILGLARAR